MFALTRVLDFAPATGKLGPGLRITIPCVLPNVDEAAYHADPVPRELGGSISQSGAKLLIQPSTPADFRYAMDNPPERKKQYDVGHAVHAKVLGEGAPIEVIDGNRNATAVKAAITEAEAKGLIVLKSEEHDLVDAMAEAVLKNPTSAALFEKGRGTPEVSAFFRDDVTNVMRRARFDWLPDESAGRIIVPDLKTAIDVTPRGFGSASAKFHYPMQGAWYLDALAAHGIGDETNVFVYVAVRKTPPHHVVAYELQREDRATGARLNRKAIDLFAQCMESGVWDGPPVDIQPLELPYYYGQEAS